MRNEINFTFPPFAVRWFTGICGRAGEGSRVFLRPYVPMYVCVCSRAFCTKKPPTTRCLLVCGRRVGKNLRLTFVQG